ncbi:MAG: phosphosulfolactate synthase [Chloroflexi bacterium]|nr:phosphosulfolactate synthase [Chloroflexota bacterium]
MQRWDFLRLPQRSRKPRSTGITIARDWGFGRRQAEDVCEALGELLDYIKIRHWALWYQDEDLNRAKIHLYRAHDIKPFPGGIVFEVGYLRGELAQTYRTLVDLGFPAIEISDNIVELTLGEKQRVVAQAIEAGLEVLFEYGKKYPAEAFDVADAATEIRGLLAAGAAKVILERSQLDVTLGPHCAGSERQRIIDLANAVGLASLIFEAETVEHQLWLIRTFGPEINFGPNIAPEHVAFRLEPARCGLGRDEGYSLLQRLGASAQAER